MNVVKIRGLPYNIRYEEVADFFQDFKYINQSVVLGLNNEGRKNGFGAILFEDEEEAARAAKEMNKQYIGSTNRYVDLSVISYEDYVNFNQNYYRGGKSSGGYHNQGNFVKLHQCVNPDNLDRSIMLKGLPYRITTEQVQEFLKDFGEIPAQNIFIEEFNGKRTGSALVVFESEEVAQSAKKALQKSEIEGRYIEFFDQNDEFMRKVCRLDQ
jgi:RNA recognition motif-containing protein